MEKMILQDEAKNVKKEIYKMYMEIEKSGWLNDLKNELQVGSNKTQYLKDIIINKDMLARWQNALIKGDDSINNHMESDEYIYDEIFPEQLEKFQWKCGVREDDEEKEKDEEEIVELDDYL